MRILSGRATQADVLRAAFDQVRHEIIVLDAQGAVVMVNEPYLQFGRDNGWDTPQDSVGTNYLALCAASARDGNQDAGRIAGALASLLRGERRTFTTTYRCDSPWQLRWFRLTISPWASDGEGGAIMVHENITAQVQAERAVDRAATGWQPQDDTQYSIKLQDRLDTLAWRLEEATGDRFMVEGAADLAVMTAPDAFLTALARLLAASSPMPEQAAILHAEPAGRDVILSIHGLRRVDQASLDALSEVPGRCDASTRPTPRGWEVKIVLRKARRAEA